MPNFKTIYFQAENQQIEIRQDEQMKRLLFQTQEIAKLFNKSALAITRQINKLYEKGILNRASTFSKNEKVGQNGKVYQSNFYTLDVVLEVGRSLKSLEGLKLKQYLEESYLSNNVIEPLKDEEIIIYNNGDISIDVKVSPKEDTVWLTKDDMAILFGRDRSVISKHINNIVIEEELDINRVCAKNARTGPDGKNYIIDFYNLDVVISVGYRVKSKNGIAFRKWANGVLKEFLLKGYAIDEKRAVITKENYLELKNRVLNIQLEMEDVQNKIENIEEKIDPKEKIFAKDTQFDSFEYLISLFSNAKDEILVVDPFFDNTALKTLIYCDRCVKKTIYLSSKSNLSDKEIELFRRQYGEITFILDNEHHDRFIYIDRNDLYLLGPSLNRIGFKFGMIVKVDNRQIIDYLLSTITKV